MDNNDKNIQTWQNKILPFAIVIITILLIAFTLLYIYQVKKIQDSFLTNVDYNVTNVSKNLLGPGVSNYDKLCNMELVSLLNRHYSASLIIKSRILTINLSFLTGMILCFIGGLFVLGKFSEEQTKLSAGQDKLQLSLASSSPGIIISFLGVCLIAISIFSKTSLLVEDKPVYLRPSQNINTSGEINIDDSLTRKMIDSLRKLTK